MITQKMAATTVPAMTPRIEPVLEEPSLLSRFRKCDATSKPTDLMKRSKKTNGLGIGAVARRVSIVPAASRRERSSESEGLMGGFVVLRRTNMLAALLMMEELATALPLQPLFPTVAAAMGAL
jgi:hypothetical protein